MTCSESTSVDLWFVPTGGSEVLRRLDDYRALLNADERQLLGRFRLDRLQVQYLATRALVRCGLAGYLGCSPRALQFRVGPHGKPALLDPPHADWHFNLSHTEGAVILAVSRHGPVGVDLEPRRRKVNLGLAERYFAPSEIEQLRRMDACEQPLGFLRFWTLKEAFIKALGTGLATPLASFAFRLDGPAPTVECADPALGVGSDWAAQIFDVDHRWLGAVVVQGSRGPCVVRLRSCVPLRDPIRPLTAC